MSGYQLYLVIALHSEGMVQADAFKMHRGKDHFLWHVTIETLLLREKLVQLALGQIDSC